MGKSVYKVGGNRGCQCEDGTYKSKCCNGKNQRVGSLIGQSESIKKNVGRQFSDDFNRDFKI